MCDIAVIVQVVLAAAYQDAAQDLDFYADYIAGNTCNHYAWANGQFKKWASGDRSIVLLRSKHYSSDPLLPLITPRVKIKC